MTIVVVEDDEAQIDFIERQLKKAFAGHDIRKITSESEFRAQFDSFATNGADLFVIDVMIGWSPAVEGMELPPDDIRAEGPARAGFRCRDLLAADERTKHKPVILYTVLDKSDIAPELNQRMIPEVYVQKRSNQQELIKRARRFLEPKAHQS